MMSRHFGKLLIASVAILASNSGWSQSSYQQVVSSTGDGNKVFLEVNAYHLQQAMDSIFANLTSISSSSSTPSWSDVLDIGSDPGMDINFNSYDITGLGELTAGGTLTADSLLLNKDAAITGRLGVSGVAELGDSLSVSGFVEFSDSLQVVKAVAVGQTLYVTGVTSLGDSLHVVGNVDFEALFNVDGAATFGSTLSVTGVTSLSDSLHVTGGADFDSAVNVDGNASVGGTLGATGATSLGSTLSVTGVTSLSDSLHVTGGADFDSAVNVDGNASVGGTLGATGATSLGSTLSVTGVTSLSDSLHVSDNADIDGAFNADGASTFGSSLTVSGVTTLNDSLHVMSGARIMATLYADSASTNGLSVAGSVRIADGTQGAGKVLTSDANGYTTWQTATSSGGGTTYTAGTGINISGDVISIGQAIATTDDVTVNQLYADSISVNEAVNITGALTVNDTNILAIVANLQAQIDALTGGASATPCGGETTYTYHETTYDLVELSGQCWFADDLKTKNLNSGIALSQGNPFFDFTNPWGLPRGYGYIEDGDGTNYYDYFSLTSDILCPKGWHVPTIDDANNAKDDAGFGTAFVSSEGGAFDNDYSIAAQGRWGIATSPGYGLVSSFDTFGTISPGFSENGGAKTRCVKD